MSPIDAPSDSGRWFAAFRSAKAAFSRLRGAIGSALNSSFLIPHGSFFVLLLLLLIVRSSMFRDPGTFWHVACGQRMLDEGRVIRQDPFSFTRAGAPWVADQWLAECGMALVHRLAGWDGLLLLWAAVLAGTYAWLAGRLTVGGLHVLPALLLTGLALMAGSPQFHVRPLVFSIGLLGLTFAWLVDVEAGRKPAAGLWWLVPLFVLWTNLHGGALAGMATASFCLAGWSAAHVCGAAVPVASAGETPAPQRRASETPAPPPNLFLLAPLLVTLLAAVLVNPYGAALPREWLETIAMPLPSLIEEHGPLKFHEPVAWATVALGLGYAAALLSTLPGRPRVVWLLPLAWLVLAIARVRFAALFAVTAVVATADMLPSSLLGRWLRGRGMLAGRPSPTGGRWLILPLVVVGAALASQMAGLDVARLGRGPTPFDEARWPTALLPDLNVIATAPASAAGVPVFNDLLFGGFLIYHQPRLRVFIDDRCPLYGTDFLMAYDRARRADPAQIDRWRRQYGFHHALVEAGGRFDQYLSTARGWSVVRRSAAAALYQHQ
jgi:hypothetical protein